MIIKPSDFERVLLLFKTLPEKLEFIMPFKDLPIRGVTAMAILYHNLDHK